jgi:hypothetical protein
LPSNSVRQKSLFNYNILLPLDPPRLLLTERKLKHRGPVTQPARNFFFIYFTLADVKCFFPLACCQAGSPLSALASHGRHGKKEMDDGLCCCCCAHEEIPLLSFHSMGTSLYDDRGDLFIHPSSSAPRSFPPHSFWSFFSFPFCRKEIRLVCCTGSTATSSSSDGQQWLLGPGHPAGVARASLGSAPL